MLFLRVYQKTLVEPLVLLCYKITLKSRMHWQSGSSIREFGRLLILDNIAQLRTPPLGEQKRVLWQNERESKLKEVLADLEIVILDNIAQLRTPTLG